MLAAAAAILVASHGLVAGAAPTTLAYQVGAAGRPSLRHPAAARAVCRLGAGGERHHQQQQARRAVLASFAAAALAAGPGQANAVEAIIQKDDALPASAAAPSPQQTQVIKDAIAAFDSKQLSKAEALFSQGIETWESLNRPRDEMAELYKMRANARVDLKRFGEAKVDYDKVIGMMDSDGEKADGTARYLEYPDAFVQRGLCQEGLGNWDAAVEDYTRAIGLWGGGRGEGINPFVLTFRANALARTGKYEPALVDYQAAEILFLKMRDGERALDTRANQALALYATGRTKDAIKMMENIVKKRQGYTDMHVALAAVSWGQGDRDRAESEWEFACDKIQTGWCISTHWITGRLPIISD
jgi:tetratricopeptide (TPR) repeat protein